MKHYIILNTLCCIYLHCLAISNLWKWVYPHPYLGSSNF